MRIAIGSLFVVAIALANVACSPEPPRAAQPLAAKQSALVTVQFYDEGGQAKGSCAGVLVGPQAVLTAGHCASNKGHAVVTAPNAGGRKAESHRAWWFDWTNAASPKKSPQLHDVAILALDTPIALKKYPDIADEPIADGTKTLHIRRVKGKGKTKIAFEATPGVAHPQKKARAHYYKINQTKGSLDSGAPVFEAKTGKIVGVVSTRGKSRALYVTKTKSLTKWLRQQLLALLETPPKPPAPSSATAPKPPTSPATKPPTSPTGGSAPSGGGAPAGGASGSSGKMGKQAGKSTKAAGKKPSSSQQPKDPTTDPKTTEETCKDSSDGDMSCAPGVCGAAEQSSSSADDCETPCEGGDESCQDPQCNESDSCECQGEEQCGGGEDDPFEQDYDQDNDQDNDNDNEGDQDDPYDTGENDVDDVSEDVADDDYYPDENAEENESETGESDDYSEGGYDDSGYDDSGSEDYGSEDTGGSDDYGSEDTGGSEDYGSEDTGGSDDYGGEE
jgi:V8-like Glu-specific endopeptidase